VIAIKASGQITRSAVSEVPVKGRDTMGVKFVGVGENDPVVVIALNPETTAQAADLVAETSAGEDSLPSTDGAEGSPPESVTRPSEETGDEPDVDEVQEDDRE
jgi:DNA gyrase subunit A